MRAGLAIVAVALVCMAATPARAESADALRAACEGNVRIFLEDEERTLYGQSFCGCLAGELDNLQPGDYEILIADIFRVTTEQMRQSHEGYAALEQRATAGVAHCEAMLDDGQLAVGPPGGTPLDGFARACLEGGRMEAMVGQAAQGALAATAQVCGCMVGQLSAQATAEDIDHLTRELLGTLSFDEKEAYLRKAELGAIAEPAFQACLAEAAVTVRD